MLNSSYCSLDLRECVFVCARAESFDFTLMSIVLKECNERDSFIVVVVVAHSYRSIDDRLFLSSQVGVTSQL